MAQSWPRQTPQESDSWTCQMDIKEKTRIRAGMSGNQKVHGVNAGSGLGGKSSGVCPLRTRLLCPSGKYNAGVAADTCKVQRAGSGNRSLHLPSDMQIFRSQDEDCLGIDLSLYLGQVR